MKNIVIVIILFLLIVFTVVSGDEKDAEAEKKECKRASRKALKQILKKLGVCNDQMRNQTASKEEHSTKMGCVVKCILKAGGMLDENEMMTDKRIEVEVAKQATPIRTPMTIMKVKECNAKFGPTLDPSDPLCVAYSRLGYCLQASITDVCEIPLPP